jgi:hypothetical protein
MAEEALKLASQNAYVARCDFTNYTGNVITTNSISVYSSIFTIIVLHLLLSGQLEQILKDVIFRFKQYVWSYSIK